MSLFRALIIVTALCMSAFAAYAVESNDQVQMKNSKLVAANMTSSDSMMTHDMSGQAYSDRAFLSGMLPHHEAAVVMSKNVLKNGKDAQVKKWALQIIADQNAEISIMEGWLAKIGGTDKQAAAMMEKSMAKMVQSGMQGDPDYAFVSMMVPHHAGALEMAAGTLAYSKNEKIVALAQQIVIAQTDEIMAFRKWLKSQKKS